MPVYLSHILIQLLSVMMMLPFSASASDAIDTTGDLRIATYNILFANNQGEQVTSLIIRDCADIVLILEYNGHNLDHRRLTEDGYRLITAYPKFAPGGIALLAKEWIDITASITESPVNGTCSMPLLTGRIYFNSRSYAFLGIHAPPPFSGCNNQTAVLLTTIAGYILNGRLDRDIGQAKKNDPVFLLGDFNTASFNPVLDVFKSSGLRDIFEEQNMFTAGTWSPVEWLPPLLRIDFIYIPEKIRAINSRRMKIPGSDHHGLTADIKLERNL